MAWTQVAAPLASQYVNGLCLLNDEVYGTNSGVGRLLRWNGSDAWVEVAPRYGGEYLLSSPCVFGGQIYAGSLSSGVLLRWNGSNAWTQVAPRLNSQFFINCLCVFEGELYGGTGSGGRLFRWNGSDAWTQLAPQFGSQTDIISLYGFDGDLYGGTGNSSVGGRLLRWNGSSAWTQVADQFNSQSSINRLLAFSSSFYGGTHSGGRLFRWNGSDAWVEVAGGLNSQTAIGGLCILGGALHGGTYPGGRLFRWNGSDAWVEVAAQLNSQTGITGLVTLNGKIYGSTSPNGALFEYSPENTGTGSPSIAPIISTHDGAGIGGAGEPVEGYASPLRHITPMEYFTKTQPAKSEEIVNVVEVPTKPLAPAADPEEVYRSSVAVTVPASSTATVEAKYDKSPCFTTGTNAPSITLEDASAGITVAATYYAWGASVTLTNSAGSDGTCIVVITGTPLEITGAETVTDSDATSIRENGAQKYTYPGNHLIQSRTMAEAIAATLLDTYKTPRKDVNVVWRGNPAVDLSDTVYVTEYKKRQYDIRANFRVFRQKHEFDGGLRTTTDGRKAT